MFAQRKKAYTQKERERESGKESLKWQNKNAEPLWDMARR